MRWDPLTKDNVQFFQASLLYCTYYHVQIQIHRPFIIKSSPLTFPSLAICSNAARSCARLLEVQVKRQQVLPMPQLNVSQGIMIPPIPPHHASDRSPPSSLVSCSS